MMLSDVAVRRPVFAAVAAIVLCVIGFAAFFFLPVRELPDVDPPIVSVNTTYAGASAEVIESRITEPIEQRIAAELARGKQMLDHVSEELTDDIDVLMRHERAMQNFDIAAQTVEELSAVMGARDREGAVASVQMHDLRSRLSGQLTLK